MDTDTVRKIFHTVLYYHMDMDTVSIDMLYGNMML
jgi:hypothetical protein